MPFLIVLEGIDGSGKGTQAKRLEQQLIEHGYRAALLSFPRYEQTFFGARIGEFLNGEFGALADVDPFLVSLLYAGDRFESREYLNSVRADADIVILDRYVASNMAHQAAKCDGPRREAIQQWIEQVEFEIYQLPRPSLTILLDIEVDASQELILQKQARSYTDRPTDLQESDTSYLAKVRDAYLDLAKRRPHWEIVPVSCEGVIRPIDAVFEDLWAALVDRLPQRNAR